MSQAGTCYDDREQANLQSRVASLLRKHFHSELQRQQLASGQVK
jgi:hypothetical protein